MADIQRTPSDHSSNEKYDEKHIEGTLDRVYPKVVDDVTDAKLVAEASNGERAVFSNICGPF